MNGWIMLIIAWIVIQCLIAYWFWRKGSSVAGREIELLVQRHALQEQALDDYKSALAAYFAGDITLGEANAAYAHYLKVCYGKDTLS